MHEKENRLREKRGELIMWVIDTNVKSLLCYNTAQRRIKADFARRTDTHPSLAYVRGSNGKGWVCRRHARGHDNSLERSRRVLPVCALPAGPTGACARLHVVFPVGVQVLGREHARLLVELGARGHVGRRLELHLIAEILEEAAALLGVAVGAACHHVVPRVEPLLGDRHHMVVREHVGRPRLTAVLPVPSGLG